MRDAAPAREVITRALRQPAGATAATQVQCTCARLGRAEHIDMFALLHYTDVSPRNRRRVTSCAAKRAARSARAVPRNAFCLRRRRVATRREERLARCSECADNAREAGCSFRNTALHCTAQRCNRNVRAARSECHAAHASKHVDRIVRCAPRRAGISTIAGSRRGVENGLCSALHSTPLDMAHTLHSVHTQ